MSQLTTTAFYAALLALIQVVLTFSIISYRVNDKISIGSGGNQVLEFKIRCHGNFIETVPITLILLALVEYQQYLSSTFTMLRRALRMSKTSCACELFRL